MSDERDETAEEIDNTATTNSLVEPADEVDAGPSSVAEHQARTSDDFLVPGPTPESNAGMARWGLTWLAFSLILILLMLCVSFACLTLAQLTGFA